MEWNVGVKAQYWLKLLHHGQPKGARVFCSCCLTIIISLQRTSLVARSPWPPDTHPFWSVIQLTQTMSINREGRVTTSHTDGLGMLPGASGARELSTLGRDALAPKCVRGHSNCYTDYFNSDCLQIFSLTCQYMESFCFLTFVKNN